MELTPLDIFHLPTGTCVELYQHRDLELHCLRGIFFLVQCAALAGSCGQQLPLTPWPVSLLCRRVLPVRPLPVGNWPQHPREQVVKTFQHSNTKTYLPAAKPLFSSLIPLSTRSGAWASAGLGFSISDLGEVAAPFIQSFFYSLEFSYWLADCFSVPLL